MIYLDSSIEARKKRIFDKQKTILISKEHLIDEINFSQSSYPEGEMSENNSLKFSKLIEPLKFYGKQGFLQFLSDMFEILSSKEISQIGLQYDFLSIINKHDSNIHEISNNSSFVSDLDSANEELVNFTHNPKYSKAY